MLHLNEIKNNIIEKRKEESFYDIINQILLICKEDENFKISKEIDSYDKIVESTKKKLKHKQELLEQSKEIENKLKQELSELDEENETKRENLLVELGSDLDD